MCFLQFMDTCGLIVYTFTDACVELLLKVYQVLLLYSTCASHGLQIRRCVRKVIFGHGN